MRSSYTLDVGPLFGEDEREVSLLHQGRPCFSTTHSGILSVLIARFPHLGLTSTQTAVPFPHRNATRRHPRGDTSALSCTKAEEYLCVFHRDELHNTCRVPFQGSRTQTIVCTTYEASTGTHQQLPLPDFSAKSFTAGVYGIFIHGHYAYSMEQMTLLGTPTVVEMDSQVYHAVADMWWMPSPLVMKPVYLLADEASLRSADPLQAGLPGAPLVRLNATVITQFVALGSEVLALVQCGEELGLAVLHHHYPLDISLWQWLPQRVRIPGLRQNSKSFSATLSEHPDLDQQIIFLFDSHSQVVHVLKTPNLVTHDGSLSVLFTLSDRIKTQPITLPCVDPRTPQPILLSNFPSPHKVALFDICRLLNSSTAKPDSYIAVLPISASPDAAAATAGIAQAGSSFPRTKESWIIESVEYESGSSVVFSLSLDPSSRYGEPAAARRRYDSNPIRRSRVVNFPSFSLDHHPLLPHLLDVIHATLGRDALWEVEYQALSDAWQRMERKEPFMMLSLVQQVLISSVRHSLYGNSGNRAKPEETRLSSVALNKNQKFKALTSCCDPLSFSWQYVENVSPETSDVLHFSNCESTMMIKWSANACGFLLIGLHLLYESCKIQEPLWSTLKILAKLNWEISHLLQWPQYTAYYEAVSEGTEGVSRFCGVGVAPASIPSEEEVGFGAIRSGELQAVGLYGSPEVTGADSDHEPIQILFLLRQMVQHKGLAQSATTPLSRRRWMTLKGLPEEHPISVATRICQLYEWTFSNLDKSHSTVPWWRRVIHQLQFIGLSPLFLQQQLSLGVAYPLLQAIHIGKTDMGDDCTDEELAIVGRIDRLSSAGDAGSDAVRLAEERAVARRYRQLLDDDDGVIMPPDFPQTWMDTRLERAQTLLNTCAYISISDADVKTADKSIIDTLGWRVCATTVGRGMLTISTHDFKSCDSIPIPKLNLSGMTETGILISNKLEALNEENATVWPLFHNSCSAGLRFFPLLSSVALKNGKEGDELAESQVVTREKLIYQWRSVDVSARAGLLLAAGLLGHFESLQLTDVYTILVSQEQDHDIREATAIAVLLGLSCSYRGTNNVTVFKCLSVHILSLTPSDEDVEIRLNVQTAAFVSMGLLCQGQHIISNAFLLEVFLVEMTRLPSDEHCVNREGYTLGAAFGLGLVLLGSGRTASSAPLIETLIKVMEGGKRDTPTESIPAYEYFSEKCFHSRVAEQTDEFIRKGLPSFSQCSRVHEGDHYNVLVVGPAAVMALGLVFLKTEDELLARKVSPPDSLKALNGISPTMCLLRSIITPLVMWSSIRPSKEWLYSQVPSCLNLLFLEKKNQGTFRQQRQFLMMNWGYCIAGAVYALGMRYAGTMDINARDTILAELKGFMNHHIGSTSVPMTTMQRTTGAFEMCVSACCIAASVVIAGTGDQQLFSLLQKLYKRPNVSYGVYMSVSMSIGLLFMGGGRMTLSNSTPSIAALLISLYPIWPVDVKDNVCHLQALRHLYTLAVVSRVVEAIDVVSQRTVSVPIRIQLRKGKSCAGYNEWEAKRASGLLNRTRQELLQREGNVPASEPTVGEVWMQTSCLYPPPDMIERIEVCSLHHYSITVSRENVELSNSGIRLRLLEKSVFDADTFSAAILSENAGRLPHQHNPIAGRLLDWIKRLFVQSNPNPVEGIAILENIQIIQASLTSLMVEGDMRASQQLLSQDFLRAVEVTLESRYHSILTRASPSTPSATNPLHMFLVRKMSFQQLLVEMTKGGSGALATYFPAFLLNKEGAALQEERQSDADWNTETLRRWWSEALCYYQLTPTVVHCLHETLTREETGLQRSAQRRAFLALRLQRLLALPYSLLQDIMASCFGGLN